MTNNDEKRDWHMNDKKKRNKYIDDDWCTILKDKSADLMMTSSYEIDA